MKRTRGKMNQFQNKFNQFMRGRYGNDQLNMGLLILGIILSLISSLFRSEFLMLMGYIIFGLTIYRAFSRNYLRRSKENSWFLKYWYPVGNWFSRQKRLFKDMKTYRFFHCPECHQKIRVPKGKGKICITCPKCRTEFVKKT